MRQEREIRHAAFCTLAEVEERCADFTARRITAALANVGAPPPARRTPSPGAPPQPESRTRRQPDDGSASEEGGGELLAAAEDAGVVVADGAEEAEQVLAGAVAVVAGGAPDQLDEPVEGVVDVAAEQVEVGHQDLGVDVVGRGGGGRAGGLEVDVLGALDQAGAGQAGRGLDVGGVGVDELLVLRDRERQVARSSSAASAGA